MRFSALLDAVGRVDIDREHKNKELVISEIVDSIGRRWAVLRSVGLPWEGVWDTLKTGRGGGWVFLLVRARAVYRVRVGGVVPGARFGVVLHPVWGVPYIPGSSVRGAVRSYYCNLLSEGGDECSGACLEALFGAASDRGRVAGWSGLAFLDAFPIMEGPEGLVVGDVITPHYRFNEKRLEHEWDAEPKPVVGVSVGRGTRIGFPLLIHKPTLEERTSSLSDECIPRELDRVLEQADRQGLREQWGRGVILISKLFTDTITDYGVGAKTRRGYGYFRIEEIEVA
ncbi:MAG: type III-B CRISPR module RAMP protein Cmr6 [Crenarchaeota archaeon]|nr:type III-B CRISPR module RAMP protein Cmr6 [Thermoproteota archaeon]